MITSQEGFDYVFLTCIDLQEGFNLFVVFDNETKKLLSEMLNVKFENNMAKKEGIIMRKELFPMIKERIK